MKKLPANCFDGGREGGASRINTQHQSQMARRPLETGCSSRYLQNQTISHSTSITLCHQSAPGVDEAAIVHPLKSWTSVSEHPFSPPLQKKKKNSHFIVIFPSCFSTGLQKEEAQRQTDIFPQQKCNLLVFLRMDQRLF